METQSVITNTVANTAGEVPTMIKSSADIVDAVPTKRSRKKRMTVAAKRRRGIKAARTRKSRSSKRRSKQRKDTKNRRSRSKRKGRSRGRASR